MNQKKQSPYTIAKEHNYDNILSLFVTLTSSF
jgi:hypothetical protein